jgi:hypothetical protein
MRGERDHRQHGDFAEGIKTTKIDQDDIDDVGAAAAGKRLLQIEARDGLERGREHLQGDQPQTTAGEQRQQEVAGQPAGTALRRARGGR